MTRLTLLTRSPLTRSLLTRSLLILFGASLVLLPGCKKTEKWTGARLVVRFDTALQIEQFSITVTLDGSEVISGVRRPALPDGALTSGEESLILRFDPDDAGKDVRVLVDGLGPGGEVVAIGEDHVPLEKNRLVTLLVQMASTAGCGDGQVVAPEQCDDGDTDDDDGCSAICRIERGWECSGEPSGCNTVCGDGIVVEAVETCDDSNIDLGDGCSSCEVEPGWTCDGEPSVCGTLCGDGKILGDEACDDGDTDDDDGCSSTCTVEPGWRCDNDPPPSVCEAATLCDNDGPCTGDSLCDLLTGTCELPEDLVYVDCNAACPGAGTAASPYCALQDGLDVAQPGQTLRIEGGTCTGPFTITTPDLNLVGLDTAVIESDTCPAISVEGARVVLRDLKVRDSGAGGGGVAVGNGGSLILVSSIVDDTGCVGVSCAGSYCELRRNKIRNHAGGGIDVQGSDFLIVNNLVVGNGSNTTAFGGIRIDADGASPALVVNNTVADNRAQGGAGAHGGIHCLANATVVNTILWGDAGREVDGACTVSHCIVDQAGFDGIDGNLRTDPLLNAQYRLTATSPAIDAGDASAVEVPSVDIDDEPRPQGLGVDIGADERQ